MSADAPEPGPAVPAPGPEAGTATTADERFARGLRGFGPLGILAFLVILAGNLVVAPLSAVLVLLWAHGSRTPWRSLGFVLPERWGRTVVVGVLFGAAFKLAMKAIVLPLLGADPINHAYHHLVGNPAALPGMLYTIVVGAGFGEETFFRGYLFERLGRPLGSGARAKAAIVLLTAAAFGVVHYPVQGWPGAEQATIVGLVFGTIFAVTGRIWMLMIAHAVFDLVALAIIYWDLESFVAHLIFK